MTMDATRFGLRRRPFPATPDPACYYPSDGHEQALAQLLQGLADGEGLLLLTGVPGLGKTLLCHCLLERLEPGTVTAYLTNSHFRDRNGLYRRSFSICRCPTSIAASRKCASSSPTICSKHFAEERRPVVLVVDEAHHLDADLLEELRLLANLEAPGGRALQIVLVAQPAIGNTLARPELTALRQRLAVRVELGPLSLEESADFLLHHLRWPAPAGGSLRRRGGGTAGPRCAGRAAACLTRPPTWRRRWPSQPTWERWTWRRRWSAGCARPADGGAGRDGGELEDAEVFPRIGAEAPAMVPDKRLYPNAVGPCEPSRTRAARPAPPTHWVSASRESRLPAKGEATWGNSWRRCGRRPPRRTPTDEPARARLRRRNRPSRTRRRTKRFPSSRSARSKSMEASASVLATGRPSADGRRTFRPSPAETLPRRPHFAADVVAHHQPDHPVSGQYRELLAAVTPPAAGEAAPVLLLTPALAGADAVAVLLNLAVTAARRGGRRVIVVEADLKIPSWPNAWG